MRDNVGHNGGQIGNHLWLTLFDHGWTDTL